MNEMYEAGPIEMAWRASVIYAIAASVIGSRYGEQRMQQSEPTRKASARRLRDDRGCTP